MGGPPDLNKKTPDADLRRRRTIRLNGLVPYQECEGKRYLRTPVRPWRRMAVPGDDRRQGAGMAQRRRLDGRVLHRIRRRRERQKEERRAVKTEQKGRRQHPAGRPKRHGDHEVRRRVDRPRMCIQPVEGLEQRRRLRRVPAPAVEKGQAAQPLLAPQEARRAGNRPGRRRQHLVTPTETVRNFARASTATGLLPS